MIVMRPGSGTRTPTGGGSTNPSQPGGSDDSTASSVARGDPANGSSAVVAGATTATHSEPSAHAATRTPSGSLPGPADVAAVAAGAHTRAGAPATAGGRAVMAGGPPGAPAVAPGRLREGSSAKAAPPREFFATTIEGRRSGSPPVKSVCPNSGHGVWPGTRQRRKDLCASQERLDGRRVARVGRELEILLEVDLRLVHL